MSDPERPSASADDQLRERFAKGPIRKMGTQGGPHSQEAISTGATCIDQALAGGLRRGEMVELYGDDPEAEATLICQLIARAQQQGGICAYVDSDGMFHRPYAEQLGVDVDELLGAGRLCGEEVFAVAVDLVSSGAIDVLIIDSLPALTPRAELAGPIGSGDPGLFGEMVSRGMRALACAMDRSSSVCLLTNRVGNRWNEDSGSWSKARPAAHTLDLYVSRRLELIRLTKDADRVAAPTRWSTRLRILGGNGAESVQHLDLDVEYGVGIRAAASQ